MLRLALRVSLLLLAVAAVFGSGSPGTRPVWVVVPVGLFGIFLTYAALQSGRSGASPPLTRMWETAKRGARRADRLEREGLLTGVRLGRGRRLEVVGEVRVECVGLTAPREGQGARAVVLIEATLRPHAGEHLGRRPDGELRDLCQYWSLGLRDGLWTVLAIDERAQGSHHLDEAIAAPSAAPR